MFTTSVMGSPVAPRHWPAWIFFDHGRHALKLAVHLGGDVFAVDGTGGVRRQTQRPVHGSSTFAGVQVLTAEQAVLPIRQATAVGELAQPVDG